HRFGKAILKLIDQTEVHMNFREIRGQGKHGLVFPLGCRIVLIVLGPLGGGQAGLDRPILRGGRWWGLPRRFEGRNRHQNKQEDYPESKRNQARRDRRSAHGSRPRPRIVEWLM